ncbi:MAG: metallophosphoesterase [Candidatus Thorarchaeota archaeon]
MKSLRIAAVADVHSPRFFTEFETSLTQFEKPDLFLLAGDIVNRGKTDEYPRVVNAIERYHKDVPIVACFGNEEYLETRYEIKSLIGNRVVFLEETNMIISIADATIGIVGASVLVDNSIELSEIRVVFEKRAENVSKLLQEVASESEHVILLLHYSPLLEPLIDPDSFSWWISKAIETIQPSLIIHGHHHDSLKQIVTIGSTRVYNVALPAVGSITEIEL